MIFLVQLQRFITNCRVSITIPNPLGIFPVLIRNQACMFSITTETSYPRILFNFLQMNTSGGGGFCDCGDAEAWKDGVACSTHQRMGDAEVEQV